MLKTKSILSLVLISTLIITIGVPMIQVTYAHAGKHTWKAVQIRQTAGVTATVTYYWTKDGAMVQDHDLVDPPPPFTLTCTGARSTGTHMLDDKPNDFHYEITITWSDASVEQHTEDIPHGGAFKRRWTHSPTDEVVFETRRGPAIDVFRAKVIKSPDAQLIAMQTEEGVALTDLIRTGDIEKLDSEGFTITSSAGFHMGHIGYNIRPDQSYKNITNPDAAYVLSDVNFRHALFHTYNQEEIVSSIYGYTVTAVQSLVPTAQGGWVNPEVPLHPYDPGDKTASTVYNPGTGENEDAASILRYGSYLYDAGVNNWVTPYDIDGDGTPGTDGGAPATITDIDDVVPPMKMWTPTYEVAPTSAEHGARFTADLHANGLTSISHDPREFADYTSDVFDLGDFDIYMVFWRLGRFPDHLYTMTHSDHDVVKVPGDYNAPGTNDPDLDDAVFTIISSLNHTEKMEAAYLAQEILYSEDYPLAAFSYMQLYSRFYFNAFNPDLRGIVNSPGYGSDNGWTHVNLRWAEGTERYTPEGKTIIEWIWGEEPELLNPTSADTVYAWDIIDKTQNGLIGVNPYTHEDIPSLATDWDTTEWPNQGPFNNETYMNVTFSLRNDVFWQDGNSFDADDVAFNWLFLRDNAIPRYTGMTQFLEDVEVIDTYTVRATMNTTSQFLLYDLAGTAAMLPPNVWSPLDGQPLNTIMEYNPSTDTSGTGMGPWFGTGQGFPATRLFGTGPFVFEYYDPTLLVSDLTQFVNYFRTTEEIMMQKVEMFHAVGDVNEDGYIDVFDLGRLGASYGKFSWIPGYDADADFNEDGVVDGRDLALLTWHWGEQREYPVP